MRPSTSIFLFSLLTISCSAGLRLMSYTLNAQLQPSTSSQMLAATQSDHQGDPPLPHGGKPKPFFQSPDNLT